MTGSPQSPLNPPRIWIEPRAHLIIQPHDNMARFAYDEQRHDKCVPYVPESLLKEHEETVSTLLEQARSENEEIRRELLGAIKVCITFALQKSDGDRARLLDFLESIRKRAEGTTEHVWKRFYNMISCKVCGQIKGSGTDKNSKCSGKKFMPKDTRDADAKSADYFPNGAGPND